MKEELSKNYEPAQLEIVKKAVEAIESTIDKEGALDLIPGWFIPWYELIKNEADCVGNGGFCSVFRAKWLDSEVVVKQIEWADSEDQERFGTSFSAMSTSADTSVSSVEDSPETLKKRSKKRADTQAMFRREVNIWFGFNHPNVVRLFGACHIGRPFFVCEYATNGTLVQFLRENPDQLWQKLYEAAVGIQYLHARGVVHGDLKGNNIVVGSDMKAKMTDFGLSSFTSDNDKPPVSGAWHWVAPEGLGLSPQLTYASDLYSLGMCIVEAMRIVGGEEPAMPWGGGDHDNITVKVLVNRRRIPSRPTICTDDHWSLVQQMCVFDPAKRITISTVVDELAKLASKQNKTAETAAAIEVLSRSHFSDAVSAWKAVLAELPDRGMKESMFVNLWDRLENIFNRIDNA